MADGAAYIELGLERTAPDLDGQSDRAPGSRPWRWPAVAGCAGLALLLPAGSAAPAPPQLIRTATMRLQPTDTVINTDDLVLVSSATGNDRAGRLLTAYAAPSGRRRWAVATRSADGNPMLVRSAGDVLVTYNQVGTHLSTTARSARTGAEIWSTSGSVDAPDGADTALVSEYPAPDNPTLLSSPMDTVGPTTVRAVDIKTGRTLWSSTFREYLNPAMASDGRRVVLVSGDGTVEVRQARTGAVLASGPALAASPAGRRTTMVCADTLVAMEPVGDEVTALDLSTLAVRWRRPISGIGSFGCGELLFLATDSSNRPGVAAVDLVTGAVTWQREDIWMVASAGDQLIGYALGSVQPVQPVVALETRTGRLLTDLRGWELTQGAPGRLTVLTRPLAGRLGTEIGLLDRTDTVRVLGRSAVVGVTCFGLRRFVACREGDRRMTMWRLRR